MAILTHTVTEVTQRETNDGLQFLTVERNGSEVSVVGAPGVYEVGDVVLLIPRLTVPSRGLQALVRARDTTYNAHAVAIKVTEVFPVPPKGTNDISATSETDFAQYL